jgi:hydrogenase maturation protease
MSKTVLIGGIGNVLLGDDAVGPYVVRLLESRYSYGDEVDIVDLGTPALDLTHRIAGRRAVILVDCVRSDEHPPGTLLLYGKDELIRSTSVIPTEATLSAVEGERSGGTLRLCLQSATPTSRLDPHSPSLSECLMTTEMLGATPEHLILIGIVGQCFDPGQPLTTPVEEAAPSAISTILAELRKLKIRYVKRPFAAAPATWWLERSHSSSTGSSRLES